MTDLIAQLQVFSYRIPTDSKESDGTFEWESTTMVIVTLEACGKQGIGYTYASSSVAHFIDQELRRFVVGRDPLDIANIMAELHLQVRNQGRSGLVAMALSAIDTALWDLKARIVGLPLCRLIGKIRNEAEIYASGGFTAYSDEQLVEQMGKWAHEGFRDLKMKVGRSPEMDAYRVGAVRAAIGPSISLFVDANGAYQKKQALEMAGRFVQQGVEWFEEPVTSDDLEGLKDIREKVPDAIRVAAGEYGYTQDYFVRMLAGQAVDVLQADATRCGGISGFLAAGVLSDSFHIPFSFHCAPALHLHPSLCVPNFYIGEYFHDHVRIEHLVFDGIPRPKEGKLAPDLSAPGLGLELKFGDIAEFRIY